MSEDQKNPPAQPEFGELAPEGWSWNPEANAPHTPETLKVAEAAAKAAAKAKAATAAATAKAEERGAGRASLFGGSPKASKPSADSDNAANSEKAAATDTSDKNARAAKAAKPAKSARSAKSATSAAPIFDAPATSKPDQATSGQAILSGEEKKNRAVAVAKLASDRFMTWGLLGLAVFWVMTSLGDYLNLNQYLNAVFDQLNTMEPGLNLEPYSNRGLANVLGLGIVLTQAVAMGLTFWWAIRRMRAGKMAFWVPVVGFSVSSVLVLAFLTAAFLGDSNAWDTFFVYIQSSAAAK
jgi:hypothetical protein